MVQHAHELFLSNHVIIAMNNTLEIKSILKILGMGQQNISLVLAKRNGDLFEVFQMVRIAHS